ncbi:MAG: hypothetical protein HC857_15060 [Synechococcales cyanobacterium RU_4_20]|nr:hypothetical protein [Synechococcales cyanobacterium RU_4_20]
MSQNMSPTLNTLELEAIPVERRTVETTAETVAEMTAETATATAVMNPDFHPDTFRVDRYAERLIDEVFFNVDHLLETGESLDPEPEFDSAAANQPPEASFAEAMAGGSISFTTLPQLDAPLSVVPEGTIAQPEVEPSPAALVRPDRTLRLLCGLALASLVGAIAMVVTQWPSYRALLNQLTGQTLTQTLTPAPAAQPESGTVLSPNAQFADYVQRSLNVLKDQTALNQTTGQTAIASPPALLQVPPAAIQPIASYPRYPSRPLPPWSPPGPRPPAPSLSASTFRFTKPPTVTSPSIPTPKFPPKSPLPESSAPTPSPLPGPLPRRAHSRANVLSRSLHQQQFPPRPKALSLPPPLPPRPRRPNPSSNIRWSACSSWATAQRPCLPLMVSPAA